MCDAPVSRTRGIYTYKRTICIQTQQICTLPFNSKYPNMFCPLASFWRWRSSADWTGAYSFLPYTLYTCSGLSTRRAERNTTGTAIQREDTRERIPIGSKCEASGNGCHCLNRGPCPYIRSRFDIARARARAYAIHERRRPMPRTTHQNHGKSLQRNGETLDVYTSSHRTCVRRSFIYGFLLSTGCGHLAGPGLDSVRVLCALVYSNY